MLLLVLAMMSCSDVIGSCCRRLSAVKVAPGPTGSLREVPLHQILCRCSSRLPTCLSAVRMCHLKMEIHRGSSPVPHWNTQHGSDWFIKGFKAADEVRSHQWRNADFYFLSLIITMRKTKSGKKKRIHVLSCSDQCCLLLQWWSRVSTCSFFCSLFPFLTCFTEQSRELWKGSSSRDGSREDHVLPSVPSPPSQTLREVDKGGKEVIIVWLLLVAAR